MTPEPEHDRQMIQVPETLAGLLGMSPAKLKVRMKDKSGADAVIRAGNWTFVVEFKKVTSAALVAAAADKVKEHAHHVQGNAIPLLAVPYLGEVGRRVCEETGVSWLDLSGNARIMANGLRVIVEGKPNRFLSVGRPPNLFAPKSSRVARWLLMHPAEPSTQREIARATGMDEGFVSRIVSRLEQDGYLVRDEHSAVRPRDPALLLEAWREAYRFSKHMIRRGHVTARSGDGLLHSVCDTLAAQGIEHAATGLAAAWVFTRFAAFRIVTVYLAKEPVPAQSEQLDFREDPRGANLWLVVPNDSGVFQGSIERDGIRCVHPVQTYLDLKEHPERAPEAAERLRGEFLNWGRHA